MKGGCQIDETKQMAQIKEQNKIPEKERNEMEISNLSDAEFKTLIIRMLTKLVEYGHKIRGKNEDYKKSNKGKYIRNQQ